MELASNIPEKSSQLSSGRVPPQAIEAEMAVLGALMLEKEAISRVIEINIDETCFYQEAHSHIFEAIVTLYDRGEPVDLVTLSEELKKQKKLDKIGGAYYLTELVDRVPSAANVTYHANIVLEKALMRKLIGVTTTIATECYDTISDPFELLDRAEQLIFDISTNQRYKGFESIDPILHHTFEIIESFHNQKGGITGVPSGLSDLDNMTSGFQRSDLVILAGRPSMGKTALALSFARNAAADHDIPVGLFSLEMSSHQLALRLLCSEARVDAHLVRTGRLPKSEWPKLSEKLNQLSKMPIYIDDTASMSILEIRAKARRLKSDKGLGLLIIDYLQLVQGLQNNENRQQEVSYISRSLKGLAKELDIPVIALSQLSRAVETRGGDRRPILSDLRESGSLEQDADVVLFVYRPEHYDPDNPEVQGKGEIIISKQRNGPTGTSQTSFIKEYSTFVDAAPGFREEEPYFLDDSPF